MPIKIQSNAEFRPQLLNMQGLVEYSTDKLVFLSPTLLGELTFSWISPTNRKFQERLMHRDVTADEVGYYAYSAVIYPIFTAGLKNDSGKIIVTFRSGELFSPIIRVSVNKSLLPEQTTIPASQYDEIGIDLLSLHNKDTALDGVDASLQAQIDLKSDAGHIHTETEITDLDKYTQQEIDDKLVLKADLVDGEIPASQLPSYVDDVLEYLDFDSFPISGEASKVYVDITENDTYRWSGSAYIKISNVLSAADIKTMYETNSNTNAFTDALANKLNTIATGAQVNTIIGVNGKVGNVVINTDDVAEGATNKYLTEQRITDSDAIAQVNAGLSAHEGLVNNPHSVTKVQVGLDQVDNTSDLNKPVSIPQQGALDTKADLVGGKVPLEQLPSFDGSFFEVATHADLPGTGQAGTIYIVIADETDLGTSSIYRWTGTQYTIINDAMSGADIKALYEGEADTNAFTDAYKAAVDVNTAKTGITAQEQIDIAANNAKITFDKAAEVAANTAKVTFDKAAEVAANTAKISYDTTAQAEMAANTAKVGITAEQAQDIVDNNAKISYTDAAEVAANTAKVGYTDALVSANPDVVGNTAKVSYTDGVDVGLNTTHRDLITNPHSVTKAQVGLANVDNTSDLAKPISTLTQEQLDLKATIINLALKANISDVDTSAEVDAKIAALVASSPTTLDTLNELAAALGDDPNFATTITTALGTKVDKVAGYVLSKNDFTDIYKAEVDANTLKVGITTAQANEIVANNSKVGITVQQASDIAANNAKISYEDSAAVALNTAKVGITTQQTDDIIANNAKVTYDAQAEVAANTAKVTYDAQAEVAANTAKVGYSDALVSANADVVANKMLHDFHNGTFVESFDALVVMTATADLTLEKSGTGDLTMQFSDGQTVLDCTPAQSIQLTLGTATIPQANYTYVPRATKVLTNSTSGWPNEEHIKVSYVLLLDNTNTDGPLINQNWNDHLSGNDGQGHLSHMTRWIREQGASYFSGINGLGTDGFINIVGPNAYWKTSAGIVSQLHPHLFEAKDSSILADDLHIVNDFTTPFVEINDLATLTADSTGASINNKYINLVFWGVANKGGTYDPIMVNLPSGSYNSATNAIADAENFDNLDIPREFRLESGTGFLIARITVKISAGILTVHNTVDLRGKTSATSGSGTLTGNSYDNPDSLFNVYDTEDATKKIVFDASPILTGTTRKVIMADADVNLADIALKANITDVDTSAEVDAKIAALVDTAPGTLDTLNELAAALGDDPNFAGTVATNIGVNTTAIALNTAKTGISPQQAADIVINNAKVGITPAQTADIVANNAKVGYTEPLVSANTNVTANTIHRDSDGKNHADVVINNAKVGYTEALVSAHPEVIANNAKVGITTGQSDAILANTAKTGITAQQATDIATNNSKVGITPQEQADIAANNAKVGFTNELADARVALVVGAAGPAYDTLVEIQALMEADDTETVGMLSAIGLNTAKTGITTQQAADIVANNAKVTFDKASEVAANTAKVGITTAQANEIIANNAKVSADANATNKGNVFNGNSQLIETTADGKYPALDGSLITGLVASGASVSIGETPPASPTQGDLWWDSVNGKLKIYYTDTDSSAWIDASPLAESAGVDTVNGATGAVILDTDDVGEGATNKYYSDALVGANPAVVLNTAKTGISAQQASDIVTNNAKTGISAQQASDIVTNNAKVSADANATNQGNTFNGNEQLVKTDATGKLPAIDGSQLTNLPAAPGGGSPYEWNYVAEVEATGISVSIATAQLGEAWDLLNYEYKLVGNIGTDGPWAQTGDIVRIRFDGITTSDYVSRAELMFDGTTSRSQNTSTSSITIFPTGLSDLSSGQATDMHFEALLRYANIKRSPRAAFDANGGHNIMLSGVAEVEEIGWSINPGNATSHFFGNLMEKSGATVLTTMTFDIFPDNGAVDYCTIRIYKRARTRQPKLGTYS